MKPESQKPAEARENLEEKMRNVFRFPRIDLGRDKMAGERVLDDVMIHLFGW